MSADEKERSWAEAPEAKGGQVLVKYAQALESRMESRMQSLELYAAVYSEQLQTALRPSRARNLQPTTTSRNANLTMNVARSLVETEHATITEAMPRPTFLTEDGNQPQQEKAKELQFAIDGLMSDLRGYETIERAELDKCVLGTGVHKVHVVNGRPAIDRLLISEILVDEDLVGAGRDPRQIIHRQETPRDVALAAFRGMGKEARLAIENAPAITMSSLQGMRADLIVVYDAYSMAIDEETPGRHGFGVENYEPFLWQEPWKKPRLPFVFQRWQRPTVGFYGIGIVEQVLGIQIEINRFYRTISQALRRWGVPTAIIQSILKLDQLKWTNDPRGNFLVVEPGGGAPVMMNGPILSREIMEWLQFQIDNAYKATGIAQNTAFSQREEGIPSARGQREISQKGASRLAPQSKQYERAFVDTAWLLDDILRELKEDGKKLVISTVDQGALHAVNLDEALSLEPGSYRIDVFAGNFLSRHPASKMEEVEEAAKAGIFTPDEARMLMDMPDVEAALGKKLDVAKTYRKQIRAALKTGTLTRPEAFWPDLDTTGKKLYQEALFDGQANGVPDTKLQVLRDWLVAASDIVNPPPPPPDPNAPPPAPVAAPAPAPMPAGAPIQ